MAKYRKKPVTVEAKQFFYDGERVPGVFYPELSDDGRTFVGDAFVVTIHGQRTYLENGDWVITEPDGEHHYPCKPDIFEATYEAVEEPRWMLLCNLAPGSVFVTESGIPAVKSEYHYFNGGQSRCILLESGEYAHFEQGDHTLVHPIEIALKA